MEVHDTKLTYLVSSKANRKDIAINSAVPGRCLLVVRQKHQDQTTTDSVLTKNIRLSQKFGSNKQQNTFSIGLYDPMYINMTLLHIHTLHASTSDFLVTEGGL